MRTIPYTFAQMESAQDQIEHTVSIPFEYRELAHQPVVEVDSLERLSSNLRQLEDLHGRLKFVMRELQTLIKA